MSFKSWEEFFKEEQKKDYFVSLNKFLDIEYEHKKIYQTRKGYYHEKSD